MSEAGRSAMRDQPFVSAITVWELVRKAQIGKLPPLPTIRGSFARYLAASGCRLRDLECEDAEAAAMLPPLHKDPMDRMLIATAQRADLSIVTRDAIFERYGVRVVW